MHDREFCFWRLPHAVLTVAMRIAGCPIRFKDSLQSNPTHPFTQ